MSHSGSGIHVLNGFWNGSIWKLFLNMETTSGMSYSERHFNMKNPPQMPHATPFSPSSSKTTSITNNTLPLTDNGGHSGNSRRWWRQTMVV